jgi:hypothetical protein
MRTLVPIMDEEGNVYERPSRMGMWIGGIEQLSRATTRLAFAPYGGGELTGVYRLFACDGSLLYVGITNNPLRRWTQHATSKDWWPEVDHIALVPFGSARDARIMERQIIRHENPVYNVTHSRRSVR